MKGSYATNIYAKSRNRNKNIQRIVLALVGIFLFLWTSYEVISSTDLALSRVIRTQVRSHKASQELQVKLPNVLFWTLTVDCEFNRLKVAGIRETWGQRADKLLLISNGTELGLRSDNMTLNVIRGLDSRDESWHKIGAALRYLHSRHLTEFEWFMKTDDDTYVLVDRLKHFLSTKSPKWPVYFGHKFSKFIRQGYMSGGSGYVLSRRALDLIVSEGLEKNLEECRMDNSGVEDVEIGRCLEGVGVKSGSTIDSQDYSSIKPLPLGKNCCSSEPISFHYMTPDMMRLVEWLLYVVKPTKTLT